MFEIAAVKALRFSSRSRDARNLRSPPPLSPSMPPSLSILLHIRLRTQTRGQLSTLSDVVVIRRFRGFRIDVGRINLHPKFILTSRHSTREVNTRRRRAPVAQMPSPDNDARRLRLAITVGEHGAT